MDCGKESVLNYPENPEDNVSWQMYEGIRIRMKWAMKRSTASYCSVIKTILHFYSHTLPIHVIKR